MGRHVISQERKHLATPSAHCQKALPTHALRVCSNASSTGEAVWQPGKINTSFHVMHACLLSGKAPGGPLVIASDREAAHIVLAVRPLFFLSLAASALSEIDLNPHSRSLDLPLSRPLIFSDNSWSVPLSTQSFLLLLASLMHSSDQDGAMLQSPLDYRGPSFCSLAGC